MVTRASAGTKAAMVPNGNTSGITKVEKVNVAVHVSSHVEVHVRIHVHVHVADVADVVC